MAAQTHEKFIADLKSATFAPAGQLVLSWNGTTLQAETTGANGSRQKIEDIAFSDLPFSLRAALIAQLEIRKSAIAASAPRAAADRPDPQLEREARIQRERSEREVRWQAWFDSLSHEEQAAALAKRDAAFDRRAELERATTIAVYHNIASRHSIDLANRVISDPKRRPRSVLMTKTGAKIQPTKVIRPAEW